MFKEPEYAEAEFILGESIEVNYGPLDYLLDNPVEVTFLVGYQSGVEIPPDIGRAADDRLKEATGREVKITVGFVVAQQITD